MRKPLAILNEHSFDVAVIGGGINGAASAQHLAGVGYSTLLVEKDDYASAASGRSSRVLHCGLRYLAPARSLWEHVLQPHRFAERVRSAIESVGEMGNIVKTMPERVRTLKFAMPIYRSMPYSGWHVDIAVAALGQFKNNGIGLDYRRYRKGDPNMPEVASWFRDSDEIEGIVVFRDFQFVWPERICVDAVMDARLLGATVRNYTKALDFTYFSDRGWEIRLQDSIERGATAVVTAKMVVNTARVWIDALNRRAASGSVPSRKVIGAKGVHVLVRLPEVFTGQGVCALDRHNEAIFCLPWDENHYVGPTETVYEGDFDDVRPEKEDIESIIAETNHLLPSVKLRRSRRANGLGRRSANHL